MAEGAEKSNTVVKVEPFCPERIIFCVDVCEEMGGTEYSRGVKKETRLDHLKQTVKAFVLSKNRMNTKHEFAIAMLTETTIWHTDFTADIELFLKRFQSLKTGEDFTKYNISSLFYMLKDKFPNIVEWKPRFPYDSPEFVYRALFVYSRSNVIPEFIPGDTTHTQFIKSPLFYFDALYLHAKQTKDNNPQDVYDFITDIEGDADKSYFFETSVSSKRLQQNVAKLLAHPLQRPAQGDFKYFQLNAQPGQ